MRVSYLDSIRGLACMQVLVAHIIAAFYPRLATTPHPVAIPIGYLWDGSSAVWMFFMLSGYVLTDAFRRSGYPATSIAIARTARLALPAVASGLVAGVIYLAARDIYIFAATRSGSDWMLQSSTLLPTRVSAIIIDVVSAPFTGTTDHYNPPLWTLGFEIYGSLLILALVKVGDMLNARQRWIMAAVAFIALSGTHYVCFVFGYVLALRGAATNRPDLPRILSAALLVLGIYICASQSIYGVFNHACSWPLTFQSCSPFYAQKIAGAMLVFYGAIQSDWVRTFLDRSPLVALGRYSFAIYLAHWPAVMLGGSISVYVAYRYGLGTIITIPLLILMIGICLLAMAKLMYGADRLAQRMTRLGVGYIHSSAEKPC